jgi:hypothetical protein
MSLPTKNVRFIKIAISIKIVSINIKVQSYEKSEINLKKNRKDFE